MHNKARTLILGLVLLLIPYLCLASSFTGGGGGVIIVSPGEDPPTSNCNPNGVYFINGVSFCCSEDGTTLDSCGPASNPTPGMSFGVEGLQSFSFPITELTQGGDLCNHYVLTINNGTNGVSYNLPALTNTACSKKFEGMIKGTGTVTFVPNSTDKIGNLVGSAQVQGENTPFWLRNNGDRWVLVDTGDRDPTGTATMRFKIGGARPSSANPAEVNNAEVNTRILFDASTSECVDFQDTMPDDYGTALTAYIIYSATSATTGSANFNVQVMAVAPGASADAVTESFDTANACDDTAVPGTAGYPDSVSCLLTNADNVAATNLVKWRICRNISDTASGDLEVLGFALTYTRQ